MEPKLIDMKRDKPDENSGPMAMPAEASGEQYPYGLQINLGTPELAKLGIKALPAVGTEIMGTFTGMVTSTRMEAADGMEDSSMSVQICCLDLQAEAPDAPGEKESEAKEPRGAYKSLSQARSIVED